MNQIQNPIYAMVLADGMIHDNNKRSLQVVQGEIVKVIQCVGTIAIIKPYNQRRMYSIQSSLLNINIPQDKRSFYVAFGTRRLVG